MTELSNGFSARINGTGAHQKYDSLGIFAVEEHVPEVRRFYFGAWVSYFFVRAIQTSLPKFLSSRSRLSWNSKTSTRERRTGNLDNKIWRRDSEADSTSKLSATTWSLEKIWTGDSVLFHGIASRPVEEADFHLLLLPYQALWEGFYRDRYFTVFGTASTPLRPSHVLGCSSWLPPLIVSPLYTRLFPFTILW